MFYSGCCPTLVLTSLSLMEEGLGLRTMGLNGVSGSTSIFLMVEEFNLLPKEYSFFLTPSLVSCQLNIA